MAADKDGDAHQVSGWAADGAELLQEKNHASGSNSGGSGGGGDGWCANGVTSWPPAEERLVAVAERLLKLPPQDYPPVRAAFIPAGGERGTSHRVFGSVNFAAQIFIWRKGKEGRRQDCAGQGAGGKGDWEWPGSRRGAQRIARRSERLQIEASLALMETQERHATLI